MCDISGFWPEQRGELFYSTEDGNLIAEWKIEQHETAPGLQSNPELSTRAWGEQMIFSKKVEGEVEYNDGDCAEVQTFGIEGIEKNLLPATFQIHRDDTSDTSEEFQLRSSRWI